MKYFIKRKEAIPLKLTTVSGNGWHYFMCFKCKTVYFKDDKILDDYNGNYFCPNIKGWFSWLGFKSLCKYELAGGSEEFFHRHYKVK